MNADEVSDVFQPLHDSSKVQHFGVANFLHHSLHYCNLY